MTYDLRVWAQRLASYLALGGSFACQVHDFDYSEKACPCPEPEWVCHAETKRCVKSAAASTTTGSCGTQGAGTTPSGDSFDRPDERPLSGCGLWVGGYVGREPMIWQTAPFDLVSGSIRGSSTLGDNFMAFNVPTPANHYIEVVLQQLENSGTSSFPGAIVRLQPAPTVSGYICRISDVGGSRIGKVVDGKSDRIAANAAVTWQSGDTMRCEVEGKEIRMLRIRDGETIVAVTASDTDHPEGSTGLVSFTSADVAHVIFDDVRVGEVTLP